MLHSLLGMVRRAHRWGMSSLVGLLLAASLTARDVRIEVDPAGARVEIINLGTTRISDGAIYRAPATIDFRSRSEIYQLRVSAPGYEDKIVTYDYRNERDRKRIVVELAKLEDTKTFRIASEPSGAQVWLDDRLLGETPLTSELRFTRARSSAPWSQSTLTFRKTDFQDVTLTVGLDSPSSLPVASLSATRIERTFEIRAQNQEGENLPALIEIEGEVVGESPYQATLVFSRRNNSSPWNKYRVRSYLENAFEPNEVMVSLDSKAPVVLTLEPVTEMAVTRYFPIVKSTPAGPERGMDMSAPVGVLRTQDMIYNPVDFRPVTNFRRDEPVLKALNSFCLTPDGQSLIYSVTMQAESGDYYANLFMKNANEGSAVVSQITRGARFMDCNPTMSREEGSNLVVFQSNRGPMESWDISSLTLRDGRVVGGIRQLTRDRSRLNYGPSFVSEEQPIYFSSSETFPLAQPYINLVRADGSSFTNLGEYGEELVRTEGGLIFFVREAEDNGKKQIYSITSEGLQFSSVINDIEFGRANCMQPAVSIDGRRILFVSDYHTDEKGRNNNNIYLYETETGFVQPLTDNGSDDILPSWSPTEPDVLFFLSNRGGVYNVWRMQLSSN